VLLPPHSPFGQRQRQLFCCRGRTDFYFLAVTQNLSQKLAPEGNADPSNAAAHPTKDEGCHNVLLIPHSPFGHQGQAAFLLQRSHWLLFFSSNSKSEPKADDSWRQCQIKDVTMC
jgi:hypothetical protein